MALADFLHAWSGTAFRHVPAGAAIDVLDLRLAGQGRDNRWNEQGERTLYLASDHAVALAEFARHLRIDRGGDARLVPHARQIYRLQVVVERLLDLRDPGVWTALALTGAPHCFLDRAVARAPARYVRTVMAAQGMLVPSVPFIDAPGHWVLVLCLESLPDDPRRFIVAVEPDGILRIEP